MGARTALKKTYKIISKSHLAKKLGVSYQSIDRWIDVDRMPRSEFSGETKYSYMIEAITQGQITVTDLLGWIPPHQVK